MSIKLQIGFNLFLTKISHSPKILSQLSAVKIDHNNLHRIPKGILKRAGVDSSTSSYVGSEKHKDDIEKEIQIAKEKNISIIHIDDEYFPSNLKNVVGWNGNSWIPSYIYCMGSPDNLKNKILSVSGKPKQTSYSWFCAEELLPALKEKKVSVASCMLMGVESIALEVSMKNQIPVIGVNAGGLFNLRPHNNQELFDKIIDSGGCIISSFTLNNLTVKKHNVERNNFITGICDTLFLIEASMNDSSLITANIAIDFKRDIACVPGRINDSYSLGCNHLLQNGAAMILKPMDLKEVVLGFE